MSLSRVWLSLLVGQTAHPNERIVARLIGHHVQTGRVVDCGDDWLAAVGGLSTERVQRGVDGLMRAGWLGVVDGNRVLCIPELLLSEALALVSREAVEVAEHAALSKGRNSAGSPLVVSIDIGLFSAAVRDVVAASIRSAA